MNRLRKRWVRFTKTASEVWGRFERWESNHHKMLSLGAGLVVPLVVALAK
ncbi:hypothetical protein ACFXI8_23640 [Streptomyces niveus]